MMCSEKTVSVKVEHVVPVHMSLLHGERVPYRGGSFQEGIFTTDDIVDEVWTPYSGTQTKPTQEEPLVTYEISVWTVVFTIFQWILFAVFLYKYRLGHFAILAPTHDIPMVEAARSDRVTCELTTDVYAILWTLLALSSIILIHRIITQVLKVLCNLKTAYVNNEIRKVTGGAAMLPISQN